MAENKGPSWSAVGSGFAVIVSLAALIVSFMEANTVRAAARAETWPYLSVDVTYNAEGFSYALTNKGVGPARVRDTKVYFKGERVTSFDSIILDILGPDDAFSYDRYRASSAKRRVVSPRERVNLFGVDWFDASRRLSEALARDLELEVCYCSIYDDCWISRLESEEPEPISQCRPDDA